MAYTPYGVVGSRRTGTPSPYPPQPYPAQPAGPASRGTTQPQTGGVTQPPPAAAPPPASAPQSGMVAHRASSGNWLADLARSMGIENPEANPEIGQYWASIHEGAPQFAGSYELHQQQMRDWLRRYADQKKMEALGAPGVAELGDAQANARRRFLEIMGGRGLSGSGLETAGLSNLAGLEGAQIGQLQRDWDLQKLLLSRQDRQRDEDWSHQVFLQNLINQANDQGGSFLGDILGTVGGLGASFLGGPGGGALFKKIFG